MSSTNQCYGIIKKKTCCLKQINVCTQTIFATTQTILFFFWCWRLKKSNILYVSATNQSIQHCIPSSKSTLPYSCTNLLQEKSTRVTNSWCRKMTTECQVLLDFRMNVTFNCQYLVNIGQNGGIMDKYPCMKSIQVQHTYPVLCMLGLLLVKTKGQVIQNVRDAISSFLAWKLTVYTANSYTSTDSWLQVRW